MGRLLDDLNVFCLEHRRCDVLDTGIEDGRVWMTCDCGAGLCHWRAPPLCYTRPACKEGSCMDPICLPHSPYSPQPQKACGRTL
jgi:hypothetical protein